MVLVVPVRGWRHNDFSLDELGPEALGGVQAQKALQQKESEDGR